MPYDPFLPHMFPLVVFYFIEVAIAVFVDYKLLMKWRERKQSATLHLSLVFTSLIIGMIFLIIGMIEAVTTGYFKEIYRFTFPFAYCAVVIADIFLFFFASKITNKGKNVFIPILIIGLILIIIIFLPWNWWGYHAKDIEGKLSIRLYTSLFFVVYSIIIYLYIALISKKSKKRSTDNIARLGLSLLFWSVICMVFFFIFLLLDNMLVAVYDHPGYSIFIYIGWLFTLIFIVLSYMSLVMPKWLVTWIEKRNKEK